MAEEEERWRAADVEVPDPTATPTGACPATSASWAERLRDFLFESPLPARIAFLEALRTRLETGESIATAVEEAGRETLPRQAPGLAQGIVSGQSLSESMTRFPGTFGAYETSMVRAGEESGTLDSQLRVLADSLKETLALRQALQHQLRWPLIWSGGVVMLALVPLIFRQGLQKWLIAVLGTIGGCVGPARGAGTCAAGPVFLAPPAFAAGGAAGPDQHVRAGAAPAGGRPLPGGAEFASGLRPLPCPQAAQLAARCTGSLHYESHLLQSASQLGWGASVLDVLGSVDFFPEEILEQIGQGEDEGRLPDLLAQTAGDLRRRARADTETMVAGLFLVCLGLGVLLLLLGLATNHLLLF